MSALTKAIQYVERDILFLDCCEKLVGPLTPAWSARREHQRERLKRLREDHAVEYREIEAALKAFEQSHRPASQWVAVLVPMGADESVGTSDNHGWLMEGVIRTRRI